jgi:hypothetical protein
VSYNRKQYDKKHKPYKLNKGKRREYGPEQYDKAESRQQQKQQLRKAA